MGLFRSMRIVGILVLAYSASMLPPALLSLWYNDGEVRHFGTALLAIAAAGLLILLVSGRRGAGKNLRRRDGFIVVVFFWVVLSMLGAIPLMLGTHLSFVDALFEAVSGFTTTGSTVIVGLDGLPPSVLYYRQQLQWLGGMGLVVLAIAVLPILGIGGSQLYRAETPGPGKDEKITPRLVQGARALWMIYVGLTLLCVLAYWLAGMPLFEAVAHSFSTVSTGGFSTHDASLGYFDSAAIELVATLFMLLGGINFAVHYVVLRDHNPLHYFQDTEVRSYFLIVLALMLVIFSTLALTGVYRSFGHAVMDAGFEVVSVITSTGFGEADFSKWPLFLPLLLIFTSFIGGCGGSTAGGIKVLRIVLLFKQGAREATNLMHPHAIRPIKIGGRVVNNRTIQSVWGFFSVYLFVFVILTLSMMAAGLDQVSAFSAVATSINNLGPGLGEVAYTFSTVSDPVKLLAVVAMLLGRLEIFTLLVLLSPKFWLE
ncbi:trk system potassium uptake protein TrkH [Thiogranum longum]|uniref:Trk system potassium uptake protein n=1 Tax=Thiogranum longum TaxID=1537524 RepID=A0A4R1HKZ7_9GAMM|nr:TrkH family potassium uptake protein [Thiogranum longum]TCK17882.1 trk system potassium uptake protein TrkH [Thiogranum longum]